MNLEIIESEISDNYFCLLADERGTAAAIDPFDGEQAVERIERRGWELRYLINTHFHPDHVGGNQAVLDVFEDAVVVAGEVDAPRIDEQFSGSDERGVDVTVEAGDIVDVGDIELEVLFTPGHTPGHISLLYEHHLFSGDTIFVGGAGNCRFGGDAGELFRTFRDVIRPLPPETVFYPGHDYAIRNAEFLLSMEPEHPETQSVLEDAKRAQRDGRLMKTTLGRERAYNAFMRFDDPQLRDVLQQKFSEAYEDAVEVADDEQEAVFRCVRSLRDQW